MEIEPFYAIYDRYQMKREEIHKNYFLDPYFRIGEWYATQASLNSPVHSHNFTRIWSLGDAYGHNAAVVLRSGITTFYPTKDSAIDDEFRLQVVQNGIDNWDIHDEDFDSEPIKVSRVELTNPDFDLGNWYRVKRYSREPDSLLDVWAPKTTEITVPEDGTDVPHFERLNDEQLWKLGTEGQTLVSTTRIGDLIGVLLTRVLDGGGPYPGDALFSSGYSTDDERFIIERVTDHLHLIRDLHRNVTTYYSNEHVLDPDFQPAVDYAKRCAMHAEIPMDITWNIVSVHEKMGPLIEREIERLLESYRPYLYDVNYEERHNRRIDVRWDVSYPDHVLIEDLHVCRIWSLPASLYSDGDFDLWEWYSNRLLSQYDDYEGDEYCVNLPNAWEENENIEIQTQVVITTTHDKDTAAETSDFHETHSPTPPS